MHGPTDPQLQEILRAGAVNDAMVGSPLERVTSASSALDVELSYTLTGSFFSLKNLKVDVLNGVFVDLGDVAGYLWQQFRGSTEDNDKTNEELEHDGKIRRHEGKSGSCYFVPISNGQNSSLRLRVSSGGVATVGAGAGYTATANQATIQKIADDLASALSPYVVDEQVER